uniref:Uncharacterized protein n=1 Tax=viral metagenome TaxID=1070528 RepID=A0A6H1ZU64_9ZZZZ
MATKNGVARAIEDKEWEEMKKQLTSVIRLFSGLLFVPTAGLLVAVGYGAKAGLIAMVEKLLEIMRYWWEEKP